MISVLLLRFSRHKRTTNSVRCKIFFFLSCRVLTLCFLFRHASLGFDPCSLFMSALASDIEDERRPSPSILSSRLTNNYQVYPQSHGQMNNGWFPHGTATSQIPPSYPSYHEAQAIPLHSNGTTNSQKVIQPQQQQQQQRFPPSSFSKRRFVLLLDFDLFSLSFHCFRWNCSTTHVEWRANSPAISITDRHTSRLSSWSPTTCSESTVPIKSIRPNSNEKQLHIE